ncbi:MAG: hypothetical protein CR958_00140 [Rhodobacterales bacterium]|nr:MAG: hypothetical protein CR958_00140 [Rhodobacterales bacterium]
MRVQGSITAMALCLPVSAIGHTSLPEVIPHENQPGIAAPFVEKTRISISAQDAIQMLKWQEVRSGTSPEGIRVSIAADEGAAGTSVESTPSELIVKLKRLSGLTWAQISEIFGVKPRALHYWKTGEAVSGEHHEKLGAMVAMLRFIDRGTKEENKRLLLSEAVDGKTFFELMKGGSLQAIRDRAGEGIGRVSFGTVLTEEARAKNAPLEYSPSEELSDEAKVELMARPKTRRKSIRRAKV